MQRKDIKNILSLQKKLNDDTNGSKWVFGINNKGNQINWLRCVYMETAELIDSRPWKHWKDLNASANVENEKVELTDILHFLASYAIHVTLVKELLIIENKLFNQSKLDVHNDELSAKEKIKLKLKGISTRLAPRLEREKYAPLINYLKGKCELNEGLLNDFYQENEEKIVDAFENALKSPLLNTECTIIRKNEIMLKYAVEGSLLESKCFSLKTFLEKEMYLNKVSASFNDLVSLFTEKFNFNIVHLYFGKNVLNAFRQNNGYKEGTYIKIWNGEEDNVVMMRILGEIEVNYENLYVALEREYQKA